MGLPQAIQARVVVVSGTSVVVMVLDVVEGILKMLLSRSVAVTVGVIVIVVGVPTVRLKSRW